MKKIQLGYHNKRKNHKNPIMYALVDDMDYNELSKYTWYSFYSVFTRSFYAKRNKNKVNGKQGTVYMHREILKPKKGFTVDHKNHNSLDNRRKNIRICTYSQNLANRGIQKNNTSGYKGVQFFKRTQQWRAGLKHKKRYYSLGYYYKKSDAILAYNIKAKELNKEFMFSN